MSVTPTSLKTLKCESPASKVYPHKQKQFHTSWLNRSQKSKSWPTIDIKFCILFLFSWIPLLPPTPPPPPPNTHTHSCWVEGIVFPNYFTGLSSFMVFLSLIIIVATAAMLACSDYIIETTAYLQLGSFAFNVILYFAVLLCQFFTASGATNTDHLLLMTGVFAFSCGAYFFIANTCAKSRVRSALMCREDPVLKRKTAHCSDSPETDCNSRSTSRSSIHLRMRRTPIQLNDEMNINYVDSYLGASGEASIVPLVMLNQVQQAQGKRVKGQGKRQSIDSGDVQLSSV